MADVSVKMGVSGISQFRSEITQAQASVKTYDSAMKLAEKQFKATGNAEQYMQDKTAALQGKLAAQQSAVKSAEAALKSMTESGVNPASQAYQKMQQSLLNAQAAVLDTQNDINNLGTESADAAGKTDQLASSLGGLNKKVSLEQVISGVNKITEGMEKAAAKAVELGKAIWENITDSARWSDDIATSAMQLDMDVETYQRYKGVFDTIGEITVQEWQKAKMKVQKAINDPTQDQMDILSLLGIKTHEQQAGKYGIVEGAARDFEEVFWEIGETLQKKVQSGEMTQDMADTYANALFGRGFAGLKPMFALGAEGFAAALEEQAAASEEAIQKNAELNDKLIKLQNSFDSLQAEVLAGLAPALTSATESLDGLLQRIMEYLETPEGQQALADMEKAVSGLFEDLGNIDPEKVTQGFAEVFGSIVDGIQWISNNWSGVVTGLEAILGVFVGFKGLETVLTIIKLIDGMKSLNGGGGNGGAPVTGTGGGGGGGSWLGNLLGSTGAKVVGGSLAGLAVLFENAIKHQGNDDIFTKEEEAAYEREHAAELNWQREKFAWNKTVTEAGFNPEDIEPITKATEAQRQAAEAFWDAYRENPMDFSDEAWNAFEGAFEGNVELFDRISGLMDQLAQQTGDDSWRGMENLPDFFFDMPVQPELPDDAEATLQGELNGMNLEATVKLLPELSLFGISLFGGRSHANGLPFVPFDGYAAVLHKGERVVPARENGGGSRSFSSNLYVESMYMNNGQDAEGLAAAIAAANRRTMNGFGS